MNSEAKKCFFIGLAIAGLEQAKKVAKGVGAQEELAARELELTHPKEEIDLDFLYREFFYFSGEEFVISSTVAAGSILKEK